MADITISDLELAPALADDMVLPVENTTDTYAATLAMLRRMINKTFVEVENADFNALTDYGFYQCTGTPTNSPVAGAINWTLQVSAENGVVVQRAFSLDDNFANLYIRRWNSLTWTGWIEIGAGALDNKANINLDNLSLTGQAKFDAKANVDLGNLSTAGQAILNGKADINASNFTAAGKANIVGWGMPDYSAGVLALSSVIGRYTCPKKGWILYQSGGGRSDFYINNVYISKTMSNFWVGSCLVPVEAGDVAELRDGKFGVLTFYPCKGVN